MNKNNNNLIDINIIRDSLQQVCSDVWKNYKSHTENFNQNDPGKFWDDWTDDLSVFDEAYKDNPIKYDLFLNLAKGLFEGTKRGLYEQTIKEE